MKKNIWLDGIMGLVVGDALGVPVQFLSRDEIKNRPEGLVTGMEAGGVYYFMVKSIIDGVRKDEKPVLGALLQEGIDNGLKYYGRDISNLTEMAYLGRLFHLFEFKDVPEEQIRTSGYVIDSIEAAVWCLITTDSYKECMLKAVNLGDDTDTVAAIAGGLAGLYYSYGEIPKDWLAVIKKREWIEGMCEAGQGRLSENQDEFSSELNKV